MRSKILLAATAFACLLAAGCGGSSDSSESATAGEGTLTKEEFIAAADELCAQGGVELDPLEERLEAAIARAGDDPSPGNLEEAAGAMRQITFNAERQLAAIQALGPPAADAEDLEEIFDQLAEGLEVMRELATAIEDRDFSKLEEIGAELEEIEDATFGRMNDYGMEACGSD